MSSTAAAWPRRNRHAGVGATGAASTAAPSAAPSTLTGPVEEALQKALSRRKRGRPGYDVRRSRTARRSEGTACRSRLRQRNDCSLLCQRACTRPCDAALCICRMQTPESPTALRRSQCKHPAVQEAALTTRGRGAERAAIHVPAHSHTRNQSGQRQQRVMNNNSLASPHSASFPLAAAPLRSPRNPH